MPTCTCHPVRWKNRKAYRLSNGSIEITVLLGGGHIADLRLVGSPINVLWEPPWEMIEPHTFSSTKHEALYGEIAIGKFLSGYTGHALVLGFFGMPSADEAAKGLSLHGEAAVSEWNVVSVEEGDHTASLLLEVELPVYRLSFRRKITLVTNACTAAIDESVSNRADVEMKFQWVQHVTFGEPFYSKTDATLFAPIERAFTWSLGYEGHQLLPNDTEFTWPDAPTTAGERVDLAIPFQQDQTGFVASLLISAAQQSGYIAVLNHQHTIAAGYSFDRSRFPWIALWEENRVRSYPPWNGRARVRGVEFGTSPMPLGLKHARQMDTLHGTPVLATIAPHSKLTTAYEIFVSSVPTSWNGISEVTPSDHGLLIRDQKSEIQLASSRLAVRS